MKKTINLFCLPFAGGSKYSFRPLVEKAPAFINAETLEYPGRGSRIKEPIISDIHSLVDDLYSQINKKVNNLSYAIYGHSMGGLLAFLLTRKLLEKGNKPPVHIFISGTSGPSDITRTQEKRSLLGKEEFIEEVKDLGGMPDEILKNDELLHFFEPILRADFKISEDYEYKSQAPLNIPFTVITGSEEDMTKEEIYLWQKETKQIVDFKEFPGNHFFIYDYINEIMDIIANKLSSYSKAYYI